MGFVISWFFCLLGFLAGSAVGWAGVMVAIKRPLTEDAPVDETSEIEAAG